MRLRRIALVLPFLSFPMIGSSEVLLIDAIAQEPPNNAAGVQRPASGMKADQIESSFGAPDSKIAEVGVPPISRWVYPAYTVYFEHDRVITTVVHR